MTVGSNPSTSRKVFFCPQCEHPLPKDARTCPECGVDLALFALLAEKAYLEGLPQSAPIDTTPDAMVPRIGEFLLEQGLIDPKKLQEALQKQKELSKQGKHQLLGQTLIKMGYVDRETLDQAINRQIIQLHAALQNVNRNLEQRVVERTAELHRALERLTELNQLKANLISNISHELRTPLAHITGYVDLISEEQLGSLTSQQKNAMEVIQRASVRLGRLIEDLIEFSTASREGLKLNLQTITLPEVTSEVIERSREKAAKASVEVITDIGKDLPAIIADPERLSWVIFQLLENAIKFTPSGGQVQLIAKQLNRQVTISIRDNGIGIPKDRQKEIFEPFHQLDGSPTRRYGGTGLGLALVQLILRSHGCNITVDSDEGKGSTFSFPLPIAKEAS
jgi:signal transduction histidine kinase